MLAAGRDKFMAWLEDFIGCFGPLGPPLLISSPLEGWAGLLKGLEQRAQSISGRPLGPGTDGV